MRPETRCMRENTRYMREKTPCLREITRCMREKTPCMREITRCMRAGTRYMRPETRCMRPTHEELQEYDAAGKLIGDVIRWDDRGVSAQCSVASAQSNQRAMPPLSTEH